MAKPCSVCIHIARREIDRALLENVPLRSVAAKHGVSVTALHRHKNGHIPPALAQAAEAQEVADADSLLEQLQALRARADAITAQAEQTGDLRTALAGIREMRATLEVLLEVQGELQRAPYINIAVSAEWAQLRTVIVQALEPYPDARRAVAEALEGAEA